jgi:MFS family permease
VWTRGAACGHFAADFLLAKRRRRCKNYNVRREHELRHETAKNAEEKRRLKDKKGKYGKTCDGREAGGREVQAAPARTLSGSIWTGNFVLLCTASLALLVCAQVLLPTLPLYVIEIGGTERDVGFVMGAYTICATVMRTLANWLSDRYGRKRIVISALVIMLATTLLYRMADNVLAVGTVRGLHGLFYGLASTTMGVIVADSLPVARMAEGLGYYGLTATLSMGLAPMIGIWLVTDFGYSTLFVVVTSLAAMTLAAVLPVRSARARVPVEKTSLGDTVSNLLEKTALLPSVVMFLLSLVNGAMIYYIAIYAARLHIGNVGPFFAASSLFMVVSRPVSGRWADRGGSAQVILIGFLSLFVGMIAISLSHTMAMFLFAGAFVGVGYGFSMPTLQALAVRNAPAGRRGAATGTYYVSFDLGIGMGAVVWGFVAAASGYRTMYFTTLIPLALAAGIYYKFKTKMDSPNRDVRG